MQGSKKLEMTGGASQDRTGDLCSAIAALSQLSYSPTRDTGRPATGSGEILPEEHSYFSSRVWKDQVNRQLCRFKTAKYREPPLMLAEFFLRNYSEQTGQLYSGRPSLPSRNKHDTLALARKICLWKLWLYAPMINLPESCATG